jgi:hypothetical protein
MKTTKQLFFFFSKHTKRDQERMRTTKRLTQVLNHCQKAGIHQNPKENLKLKRTPSTLIKDRKRQRKLYKNIYLQFHKKYET